MITNITQQNVVLVVAGALIGILSTLCTQMSVNGPLITMSEVHPKKYSVVLDDYIICSPDYDKNNKAKYKTLGGVNKRTDRQPKLSKLTSRI